MKIFGKTEEELLGQCFTKNYGVWRHCVGSSLLKKGHGNVQTSDFKSSIFNKSIQNYLNKLVKHEGMAKKGKIGIWKTSDSETMSVMQRFKNTFRRGGDL